MWTPGSISSPPETITENKKGEPGLPFFYVVLLGLVTMDCLGLRYF
jgi:hypothetical protein